MRNIVLPQNYIPVKTHLKQHFIDTRPDFVIIFQIFGYVLIHVKAESLTN